VDNVETLLDKYGRLGVHGLQGAVHPLSATGETERSIRYEVSKSGQLYDLTFYARKFFGAIETGRGPRKSNQYSGFDDGMYEYMLARGIGADLPEKKRRQLAKFLAYKINKEGDDTFKKGGRIVYSPFITKLIAEIKQAVAQELIHSTITRIKNGFNP
jgi:hypothetical protein